MSATPSLPAVPSGDDEISLAVRVFQLHTELQNTTSDLRRLEIRDEARAAAAAAEILGMGDIRLAASELVARAERLIAKNNPAQAGGRGKKTVNPGLTVSRQVLSDMRTTHAQLDDAQFEQSVQEHHELGVPITRRSLRLGPSAPSQIMQSGKMEWFTPAHVVAAARDALGGAIDLDPASCSRANQTVRATKFFTKEDDGLAQDWRGTIWLNPPFTKGLVDRFISKLVTEPGVTAWVALTSNTTEARWAQKLFAHADVVCLPNERLSFYGPDAHPAKNGKPLQGQMIAARFNLDRSAGITRFIAAFSDIGWICRGVHGRAA